MKKGADALKKLRVPRYAKCKARKALLKRQRLPESKRFGLTAKQARKLGIASGVKRAKQLVRSKSIPPKDAERVAAFYQRFKGCRTPKCEGALDLWGGRRFGRKAVAFTKKF